MQTKITVSNNNKTLWKQPTKKTRFYIVSLKYTYMYCCVDDCIHRQNFYRKINLLNF